VKGEDREGDALFGQQGLLKYEGVVDLLGGDVDPQGQNVFAGDPRTGGWGVGVSGVWKGGEVEG
jgi:hypothetical protein